MIIGLDPQSRFSDIDTESLSAILFLLQQGPNVNFRTSLIHTPIYSTTSAMLPQCRHVPSCSEMIVSISIRNYTCKTTIIIRRAIYKINIIMYIYIIIHMRSRQKNENMFMIKKKGYIHEVKEQLGLLKINAA